MAGVEVNPVAGRTPGFTFRGTILSRNATGMKVLNFLGTMVVLDFSTVTEVGDDSDTMESVTPGLMVRGVIRREALLSNLGRSGFPLFF